ncbi:MAG: FkbM family methyltransferase [Bacteroidia bacterium]|nr:FkbM family methyltransferase [Bacteroidia bacterium]NNJ56800.1 FkbM family methyltransferase [Bacteroidia bacterium]
MSVVRFIKRSHTLYNAYLSLRVFLKYKSFSPSKLKVTGSDNFIHTNPKERRGKSLLMSNASGQQWIKQFWLKAVDLNPNLVLDCGINYGEILFFPIYNKETMVLGFEADPTIIPLILKSQNIHPNKDQMQVFHCLLSNKTEEEASFYIKKNWSGGSSAILDESLKQTDLEEIKVQKDSIDNLIKDLHFSNDLLLFKIDVEGYEPFVIEGMEETLASFKNTIGTIEFNPEFFEPIDVEIQDYLDSLFNRFKVYIWKNEDTLSEITSSSKEEFIRNLRNSYANTDIILATSSELVQRLGYKLA